MTRTDRRLLLLVAAEVVLGGILVGRRLARPAPPEPDAALLDPLTAQEIRSAAAKCDTPEDWRGLGELYMAAGCFRESEVCHRVACELAPADATFAREWAFALERLALLDEANAQYRRAAELRREEADASAYFIGRNLLRADKPAEARTAFAGGRGLDANRYELARLHLRAGELAEAAALHGELLAAHPRTLQIHHFGHRLALERGDLPLAARHSDGARYATEKLLNPFDAEAARVVKVTQSLGPGRRWTEARDLIAAGRLDEAEKGLLEARQADPTDPGVDELLAEVVLRRSRFAEAASLFEQYEAKHGPGARIAARAGDAWDAAGQSAKARAGWLRAAQLEAGANLKDVHHKLARSFGAAGDQAAADRHLARGHYFVGRDLLQFGYAPQSVTYFAAAGKHDPGFVQAWFYLGESRRLSGQPGPAADAYRACLKLNPDHGRALAGLALVTSAEGK